jgi:tetratricopeptide (TPR) repeat protein
MGRFSISAFRAVFCGVLAWAGSAFAAGQAPASRATPSRVSQTGIYLVFPFENAGGPPRLDWVGEGLEELTIQNLSDAGQQVYSHAGRAGELERYGLPSTAKLSRATMLRIAQDLDADFVIFGSFSSDGTSLTVESRVLRVDPAALLPGVRETGSLDSLMDLQTRIVWRLLSSNDHAYPLTLAEFTKKQHPLRLDAFEHYVRGIIASDDDSRFRELREAARLEPGWANPSFALGETYQSRNDCTSALPMFARVPRSHPRYVEALFATGVCHLQLGHPDRAEEFFASLQEMLRHSASGRADGALSEADLPEILNDIGIARARQGKLSAAQADVRRAMDLDPDEDDYPFNLGLLAVRANDFAAAAGYFREASGREPDNAEDRAMLIQSLEKEGKNDEADEEREAAMEALGPNALPTIKLDPKGDALSRAERLKAELDITALRLELETPRGPANSGVSLASADGPGAHVRRGRQELSAGKLDAAETEFKASLTADPSSAAAAHRGLAEVERRRGKLDDAAKELQASLQARDSAVVRTTLAKLYLEQKKSDLARAEVERALKLAPNYTEAKQLLQHLQNSKPNGGGQ